MRFVLWQMLMAELTNQAKYTEAIRDFCDHNLYVQRKTPKGLLYIEKSGTLCHAANIAFLCLQVSRARPSAVVALHFSFAPTEKRRENDVLSASETVVRFDEVTNSCDL